MAFYAYILKCSNGKYYTGHTDDLEKRLGQHQSGAIAGYTSKYLPVALVWAQDFPTRYEALEAEMKIKAWSQAKKNALIAGDWDRLSFFAKPPKERPDVHLSVSTSLDTNGVRVSAVGNRCCDEPASTPNPSRSRVGNFNA